MVCLPNSQITMMNITRPIPESYWVRPNQFLAGEYPGNYEEEKARQRIAAFLEAGFTDFIDLTQSHELVPYETILRDLAYMEGIKASYTRFAIPDFSVPPRETMRSILTQIDQALSRRRKVYVHCWGGVGRTGTVVGCYLIRHGMTSQQALNQIAEWWLGMPKRIFHPTSPESEEQFEYIRSWQEEPPTQPRPDSFPRRETGIE